MRFCFGIKLIREWFILAPLAQIDSEARRTSRNMIMKYYSETLIGKHFVRLVKLNLSLIIVIFFRRWLDYLLSRIVYQAKAFAMHAYRDRNEVAKRMDSIIRRLDQIEEKATKMKGELRNHLEDCAKRAVHELSEYLKSDEVRARFNSWNLDEGPKVESSWEETESNITEVLKKRLQEIIEQWEEDNQVFSGARKSL